MQQATTTTRKATRKPAPTFYTDLYEWSHGRKPRGKGGWAFLPDAKRHTYDPLTDVVWIEGARTLTEAKRELARRGHTGAWQVAP